MLEEEIIWYLPPKINVKVTKNKTCDYSVFYEKEI